MIDKIGEEWRPIPDYEGLYEVSNFGRLRRIKQGSKRLMSMRLGPDDYVRVCLSKGGKVSTYTVHSLVLQAFAGPRPEGMQAAHDNGIGSDNRLSNLQWKSRPDNQLDRVRHGTHQFGSRNPSAVLTPADVIEIRTLLKNKLPQREIATKFGVSQATISLVNTGKYVGDNYAGVS